MDESTLKQLKRDLKINCKAVGIPEGAAEDFIKCIIKDVAASIKTKKIITDDDIYRAVSASAKKYNKDLAYVYKIRGKII